MVVIDKYFAEYFYIGEETWSKYDMGIGDNRFDEYDIDEDMCGIIMKTIL